VDGGGLCDNTAAASTPVTIFLLEVIWSAHVASTSSTGRRTGTASGLLLVVFPDFANQIAESLIHIDALLGGSLDELAVEMLREVTTLVHSDLPLELKVTLVGDNDDRERILVLYSQDLLVEGADFLERIAGGDRVDEKEALAGSHVLLPHSTIFFLSSRIQHVEKGNLLINDALLSVRIFDGRVIFVNEMALNKLDSQSGFSDTTTAHNNKLVFTKEKVGSTHF